jgi:hypothetical protein
VSTQPLQPAVTGTRQTRGRTSISPRCWLSASPRESWYRARQRPRLPACAQTTAWPARPRLMHSMSFRTPGSSTGSPDWATTSAVTSLPTWDVSRTLLASQRHRLALAWERVRVHPWPAASRPGHGTGRPQGELASFHHASRRDKPSSDTARETTRKISFKPTSRRSSHLQPGQDGPGAYRTLDRILEGFCPSGTACRHPQVMVFPSTTAWRHRCAFRKGSRGQLRCYLSPASSGPGSH